MKIRVTIFTALTMLMVLTILTSCTRNNPIEVGAETEAGTAPTGQGGLVTIPPSSSALHMPTQAPVTTRDPNLVVTTRAPTPAGTRAPAATTPPPSEIPAEYIPPEDGPDLPDLNEYPDIPDIPDQPASTEPPPAQPETEAPAEAPANADFE